MANAEDLGLICICAERYALGRQSYIPSVVQGFIKANISDIDDNTIKTMIKDIQDAEKLGFGLGDDKIDKPGWLRFLALLQSEIQRRKEQKQ